MVVQESDNMQKDLKSSRRKITADDLMEDLKIKVIRNSFLRITVAILPGFILLLLLADWLVGNRVLAGDPLRRYALLVIAVEFFVFQDLFGKIPAVIETIWNRNLITDSRGSTHLQKDFFDFIHRLEAGLNSRWAISVGAIGALLGLIATLPVLLYIQQDTKFYNTPMKWLTFYFGGHMGVISLVLGYLLGLAAWRVGVTAVYISRLGRIFEIKIQPNHPDLCGGLRPLGNLCTTIALTFLAPAIFLSLLGLGRPIQLFDLNLGSYTPIWGELSKIWLLALCVSGLLGFLWPLFSIHGQMQKQQRRIQAEVDELGRKMDDLSTQLRTKAQTYSPEQGEEQLKALDFMEKVYSENSRIPTWPIDWQSVLKFSSAQAVPILSLRGLSDPIINLVKTISNLIGKG
jgi:hypothetical protein